MHQSASCTLSKTPHGHEYGILGIFLLQLLTVKPFKLINTWHHRIHLGQNATKTSEGCAVLHLCQQICKTTIIPNQHSIIRPLYYFWDYLECSKHCAWLWTHKHSIEWLHMLPAAAPEPDALVSTNGEPLQPEGCWGTRVWQGWEAHSCFKGRWGSLRLDVPEEARHTSIFTRHTLALDLHRLPPGGWRQWGAASRTSHPPVSLPKAKTSMKLSERVAFLSSFLF